MVHNLGFIMKFLKHFLQLLVNAGPLFLKRVPSYYSNHPEHTGRLVKPTGPAFLLKSFFFFHPYQKKVFTNNIILLDIVAPCPFKFTQQTSDLRRKRT